MEFTAILGLVTIIAKLAESFRSEIMRSEVYTPEQKAQAMAIMDDAFASDRWQVHGDLTEVQAALKTITEALTPKP